MASAVAGCLVARPQLARHDSDREDDDRRDDPVVESALDVERAANAGRYPVVIDDLSAERRVGRSQRRTDEAGEGPREVLEETRREQGSQDDGQGKADDEEP